MEHTSLSHNKDYLLCKNPIAKGFFSSHREKGVLVWVVFFFFCFERVSGIGRPNMGRSPVFFCLQGEYIEHFNVNDFSLKNQQGMFFLRICNKTNTGHTCIEIVNAFCTLRNI